MPLGPAIETARLTSSIGRGEHKSVASGSRKMKACRAQMASCEGCNRKGIRGVTMGPLLWRWATGGPVSSQQQHAEDCYGQAGTRPRIGGRLDARRAWVLQLARARARSGSGLGAAAKVESIEAIDADGPSRSHRGQTRNTPTKQRWPADMRPPSTVEQG